MGNIFAATDYAGGEIAWTVCFAVTAILSLMAAIYFYLDDDINSCVIWVLITCGVIAAGIIKVPDVAKNRGETLRAYGDLQGQGFERPVRLSVSDHRVAFRRPNCLMTLRLEQIGGKYVVVLFKVESPRPLLPQELSALANSGCRNP